MTALVLRLAGPLQSWSGYRLLVSKETAIPTSAVPRKSAVSGLIGAAIGSRDLAAIGARYELFVRVEATNPTVEDYQTLNALPGFRGPADPGRATMIADRAEKIRTADARRRLEPKRDGGNVVGGSYTSISRKDYLSHSEFIVALDTDDETVKAWLTAIQEPVFMTYLGRKACPPTFPFVLGLWAGRPLDLFAQLPRRDRYGDGAPTRVYQVTGDYELHHAAPLPMATPPTTTREEQLRWLSQHLSR